MNILLIFICFHHFLFKCIEMPFLVIILFYSVKHTHYSFDNDRYCHISKGLECVYICDLFFFFVCCVSITFGWEPIHLRFNIHFCSFSKQTDWWSVFRGFALWNVLHAQKTKLLWLLWDCHYLIHLHVFTNPQNTFPIFLRQSIKLTY